MEFDYLSSSELNLFKVFMILISAIGFLKFVIVEIKSVITLLQISRTSNSEICFEF